MKKRNNGQLHDQLVSAAVRNMVKEGCTKVYADLPDHDQPNERSGYRPDAVGYRANALKFIVEAETPDTLLSDHTTAQLRAFAKEAADTGAALIVVVPEGSTQAANTRLEKLGLAGTVWYVPN